MELLIDKNKWKEEWRDLPEIKNIPSGKYQVSNFGRVRHKVRNPKTNPKRHLRITNGFVLLAGVSVGKKRY